MRRYVAHSVLQGGWNREQYREMGYPMDSSRARFLMCMSAELLARQCIEKFDQPGPSCTLAIPNSFSGPVPLSWPKAG